jgi:hypothetical protein
VYKRQNLICGSHLSGSAHLGLYEEPGAFF